MMTAFSEAALVLNDSTLLDAALRNAHFIHDEMVSGDRLQRTWKNGEARLQGYVDDYAHVIEGFLGLYQGGGEISWLERAAELMEIQLKLFYDSQQSDFFFTSAEHESLPLRPKEFFDNAIPSGNSVTALNLLRLAVLTGDDRYRSIAETLLEKMATGMTQYPLAFGNWLCAADFYLGPQQEIVLIGPVRGRMALLEPVRLAFLPHKILIHTEVPDAKLAERIPLLANRTMKEGKATAYLCEGNTCQEPVTDPRQLEQWLETG